MCLNSSLIDSAHTAFKLRMCIVIYVGFRDDD